MKENWKDIKGYEGLYQVSDRGRIKSLNYNHTGKEKLLTPVEVCSYMKVCLTKGKTQKQPSVHRLVAEAFIPNPDNLPEVNHKDEDKTNNQVENLEWCTSKYNVNYGTAISRRTEKTRNGKLSKPIAQFTFDLPCELIKVWPSINEIHRQLGYDKKSIINCCKGKEHYNTAYGYQWAYWEE